MLSGLQEIERMIRQWLYGKHEIKPIQVRDERLESAVNDLTGEAKKLNKLLEEIKEADNPFQELVSSIQGERRQGGRRR